MSARPAWHQTFENAIAADAPLRSAYPWRPWLCLALLVACFVPRAVLAWRADVICEDGPFYVMAARHLENGDYAAAFAAGNFRLNTYPILLAVLHAADWDWVSVGKWCSVAAAVLAVLPLFGWVRRQFNDSIATLTCLIYASHPTLIERSPEVLRCPTYWLLLMLTLYLLWRAVIEVRIGTFALAGLAMALAVHTRVEGWFVVIPWALWSAMRFIGLRSERWRLAVGAILFAGMIPAFIVAVNMTWLRHHAEWEFCFSHRIAVVQAAVARLTSTEQPVAAPVDPPAPAAVTPAAPAVPVVDLGPIMPRHEPTRRAEKMAWDYVRKLVDAFGIACGMLAMVGLGCYWRVLLRRDQAAVLCMSLITFAAIAAQQWRMGEVIGRYFFPILLVTLPYISLGLHEAAHRLAGVLRRWSASPALARPLAVTAGLMMVVASIGCIDAMTNSFESRRQRRDLGEWVLKHIGPQQRIMGPEARELALMYYSEGHYTPLHADDMETPWFRHVMNVDPVDVVVIFKQKAPGKLLAERFQGDSQLPVRYQAVAAEELPASCRNATVLIPSPTAQRLALKPRDPR